MILFRIEDVSGFDPNTIFIFNDLPCDTVIYTGSKGVVKVKYYSIMSRLQDNQGFFNKSGQINLNNFVIDISNNTLLHQYLKI